MIAYIKGKVVYRELDYIIVENHGIGYEIFTPDPMQYQLDEEVIVYTYEHIREDADMLFGFSTMGDKALFLKLISVKGIGPKIALGAIAKGGSQNIIEAIEKEDAKYLKSLPGIGAKASSQIVLDLKGKLVVNSETSNAPLDANLQDAIEGLKVLGYKNNEINKVIKEIQLTNASVDEYMKEALKIISKAKGV